VPGGPAHAAEACGDSGRGRGRLLAPGRPRRAGTIARLKALRKEFVEPLIAEYHGRVVKLMGDGALVKFASPVDAVECAVAIQKGVTQREAVIPESRRIAFRIGIDVGDIIVEDGDILGDGVNIAARLEGLAEPGGICIARSVWNPSRQSSRCRSSGWASTGSRTSPSQSRFTASTSTRSRTLRAADQPCSSAAGRWPQRASPSSSR
jgi:hypothetical protein